MNTKKALKALAPPETASSYGLGRDATIGALINFLTRRIAELEALNAKGVKDVPVVVKEVFGDHDNKALFEKLVGTPSEIAAERKLRELAYAIVARTATNQEINLLVEARIIQEPERGAIIVPEPRLLQ